MDDEMSKKINNCKKAKKLIDCFDRVVKMVDFFIKRDLTLITYYTVPDALVFVFEFDSTDGSYEYTVKVDLYHGYFTTEISDEQFVLWLEKTYDKIMTPGRVR